MVESAGFVPPPYPYDRLDHLVPFAQALDGGVVDLSIGTPCDPPLDSVIAALSTSDAERGYPPSIGTDTLRQAIRSWLDRRFDLDVPLAQLAACIGTKEFVATTPQYLRLRTPSKDTVLFPAVAYPTYEMGATLAGCRAVAVPCRTDGALDFSAIEPADAAHAVPVFSDECYVEFIWDGPASTILHHGFDGVVAVHSLSKRSNLAGVRVGFYAGDADIVGYLKEVRKHVGMLVAGPAQAAAAVALGDDAHVAVQRDRYRRRLERLGKVFSVWSGVDIPFPAGGFYLWFDAGDGWEFAERLAREGGALVSPGDFYGAGGAQNVRAAVVQPDDRIELVAQRLGVV